MYFYTDCAYFYCMDYMCIWVIYVHGEMIFKGVPDPYWALREFDRIRCHLGCVYKKPEIVLMIYEKTSNNDTSLPSENRLIGQVCEYM